MAEHTVCFGNLNLLRILARALLTATIASVLEQTLVGDVDGVGHVSGNAVKLGRCIGSSDDALEAREGFAF